MQIRSVRRATLTLKVPQRQLTLIDLFLPRNQTDEPPVRRSTPLHCTASREVVLFQTVTSRVRTGQPSLTRLPVVVASFHVASL